MMQNLIKNNEALLKKYIDMDDKEQRHYNKIQKYKHWARWKTTDYLVDSLLLACRLKADDDFINVLKKEIKERI